jgi:hypothetical protein
MNFAHYIVFPRIISLHLPLAQGASFFSHATELRALFLLFDIVARPIRMLHLVEAA